MDGCKKLCKKKLRSKSASMKKIALFCDSRSAGKFSDDIFYTINIFSIFFINIFLLFNY